MPGITSASAGAASLKQSLTRRDRNSSITFMTAHDAKGYAEHDWRQLVRSGRRLPFIWAVNQLGFCKVAC